VIGGQVQALAFADVEFVMVASVRQIDQLPGASQSPVRNQHASAGIVQQVEKGVLRVGKVWPGNRAGQWDKRAPFPVFLCRGSGRIDKTARIADDLGQCFVDIGQVQVVLVYVECQPPKGPMRPLRIVASCIIFCIACRKAYPF